jgi:hypothetical protein|mmetsp:Transcript_23211/g.57320  ORF Transcript_23211/g.57320 Transcript_23211/m.57320 type:complete len:81 (+) Transcript_23211:572-814(+)|eukprot:2592050-Prymnesium_polylepis.2
MDVAAPKAVRLKIKPKPGSHLKGIIHSLEEVVGVDLDDDGAVAGRAGAASGSMDVTTTSSLSTRQHGEVQGGVGTRRCDV